MIIESTSGTLGLGLALAGIAYEHPVTLVTDPGLEPIMHRLHTAYGTRIQVVPEPHPTGGWQEARRRRVAELLDGHEGSYCPDQYQNPDNVAGYEPLALELVAQLGRVDVLVCSVGTGGHSAGIARVLRTYFPHLRLVGVDTVGFTIFGQPARPRLMRGLGSSIHPRNVDHEAFDEVHWVAPDEAVQTARHLAAAQYASGGWSVGAVGLVASWLARTEDADTRIAAVFPDGPQRYFDTVFSDEYCHQHGLLAGQPPREPDEIREMGEREITRWTRCRRVVDPTGRGWTSDRAQAVPFLRAAGAAAAGQPAVDQRRLLHAHPLPRRLPRRGSRARRLGRGSGARGAELLAAGDVPHRRNPGRPARLQAAHRRGVRAADRRVRSPRSGGLRACADHRLRGDRLRGRTVQPCRPGISGP